VVTAWTTGGNIPDAIVRLKATPSSAAPKFSFGCGSSDGTASCDLGAMDATSVQRQLQADSEVPATATSVKSVKLTVIGSAAKLPKDPTASATVQISGTATTTSTTNPTLPITTTTPLPVGSLPDVPPATSPTLSPGGNAAKLFPTLQPSPNSSASKDVKGRAVANTAALPEGTSVVGASLIGLAALALAFVLAVTRFSIRRRPTPATPAGAAAAPPATDKPAPAVAPTTAADKPATVVPEAAAGQSDTTPEPVKDTPQASEETAQASEEAPKASEDAPEAPYAAPETLEDPADDPTAENNPAKSNPGESNPPESNPSDSSADGSTPDA
jgi:hypothetical protein